MSLEGQRLGEKYRILRLVGDGGMGAVYEAEHLILGTRVAIKVLHADLAERAGLSDRFLQEARVAAQIKSPHVVQVHDMDRTAAGIAFLVMELLSGEPLSRVLDREHTLSEDRAIQYTLQILEALVAAHALGVIHRDLKPENVFVTLSAGKPLLKLIDFGIAKLKTSGGKNLTAAGAIMGTAEYMAPEQAFSASEVDVRADLYSVGVMLYEMLSGRRPVTGNDPRVIALQVDRGEVTPLVHAAPGVRPELAGLVHKAMAPRPELRFANAAEMRMALEAIGQKAGVVAIGSAPALQVTTGQVTTGKLPQQQMLEAPRKTTTQNAAPIAGVFDNSPAMARGTAMNSALADTPLALAPLAGNAAVARPATVPAFPSPPEAPRRRVWPWVVIPLAIGAGVGATLVIVDVDPFRDDPPKASAPPASAPPPVLSAKPTSTAATTVAPLSPPGTPPPTTPGPVRPGPTASVEPTPTFTPMPPPPILSGVVLPTALPTSLPSGFPNPFPIPTVSPPPSTTSPAPIPTPIPR